MGHGWIRRGDDMAQSVPTPWRRTLVLFDVDGTLLDGAALIVGTMADAFLAAGETPPDAAAMRAAIGLAAPEMIASLAPGLDPCRRAKVLNGYRLRYFDLVEDEETPPVYPGASAALARLSAQGYALGLATGKARRSLMHVLNAMRWTQYFQTIQCADLNPSKPSAVMVRRALLETGRAPSEAILVGDSRHDMQMARAAGIAAVGVSWGYAPPEVLRAEGAQAIARDFDHLIQILAQMEADRLVPAQ